MANGKKERELVDFTSSLLIYLYTGEIMGLKIVYGKSGTGKTEYCFKEVKNKINENKKIYIITPEQFSFTAERKLMDTIDTKAITNTEVITFNRMAYRILNEVGGSTQVTLSNCGKSMLIYSVLHKNKKSLNFLNKSDENIEVVANAITELKKHNVTLADLEEELENIEDEYLKRKLTDIIILYKSYNEKIEDKYIDENDLLTILSEKINYTNEYNNSCIYIDEFAGFTTQEYSIISKLIDVAEEVTITICSDNLEQATNPDTDIFYDNKKTIQKILDICKEKNIKVETINLKEAKRFKNKELEHLEENLYAVPYKEYKEKVNNINLMLAKNQYSEIENIAQEIIKIMQNENIQYSDFSVITKNLDTYSSLIKVIFNKYNIPYFMDEKRNLNQNLVIKFIVSLFEIYTKNWSFEAMFNYIKSGFLWLDNDDIFSLEKYCVAWGIKGKKWYEKEWNYGIRKEEDEKNVQRLNEIREQIVNPILKFKTEINKNKTVKAITENLYNYLLEMNVDKTLNQKAEKLQELGLIDISNEYISGWNILMNIFDELNLVFGDEKTSIDNYLKILKVGIKNSELGSIPGTQDQVIIGDVNRSRSHKVKYVFIIGVNDGIFPSVNKSEGFLNDSDRELLKTNGIEMAKGTLEKLYEENFNIYKAFTVAENKLYISYASADISGKSLRPSILISRIKKIYKQLEEKSDILAANTEILTANVTFENLLENIKEVNEGKKIDDIWFDIYNFYKNNEEWKYKLQASVNGMEYNNNPEIIREDLIQKMYGNTLKTSVSKLETYKKCPFSFHLKYGLNVQEQKQFKLEVLDTGSFMHDIIDSFFNTLIEKQIKPKELEDSKLKEIVEKIIEEKLNLSSNYKFTCTPKFVRETNRLKRVVTQAIGYIIEEMKTSDFDIIGNEVEFKKGGKYEPIKLELNNGKRVEIIGKIDRIDLAKNLDGNYVRIIDYKSSIKNLDYGEVYEGMQIQLLTYLDATCEIEDFKPAGILYFNLTDEKLDRKVVEDEIKEELRKQFKMKGLILADVNIIKMMDTELESGYSKNVPARLKAGGEEIIQTGSSVATNAEFEKLQKYTKKIIKEISNDILKGNIELKPFFKVNGRKTACEYCSYKSICRFNKGYCGNDYNYIYGMKKDEMINKISK